MTKLPPLRLEHIRIIKCILCIWTFALFASPLLYGQQAGGDISDPDLARQIKDYFGPGATGAFRAANGMVTSASDHATMAGVEILRRGGNAFDAAVAVQLVLNVTEPYGSGIGGGLFALYYLQGEGEIYSLDGREEAPKLFDLERFRPEGRLQPWRTRITGGNPVGVPGTLASLDFLLSNHGTLSWADVTKPAIRLAEEGFAISASFAANLESHWDRLSQFAESARLFSNAEGKPLAKGDIFRNPDFAETLRLIAQEGIDVFYSGALGTEIIREVHLESKNPGILSLADLANYRPVLRQPVSVDFKDFKIYGMGPPSSGGVTLGMMLNLWKFSRDNLELFSAEGIQQLLEVQDLAFADRNRFLADSDFAEIPVAGLLDPHYARQRAGLAGGKQRLSTPVTAGEPDQSLPFFPHQHESGRKESQHTTHFNIVDKDRNVVVITSTIEQHFGSGLTVTGRGFLLNNELTDFDAQRRDREGNPNVNIPTGEWKERRTALGDDATTVGGMRPRSSMTPTLVMKNGEPLLALGSPGGSRIIGITFNVLLFHLVGGMELQEAVNAPRIISRNGSEELETPLYRNEELKRLLGKRGIEPSEAGAVGSVQAIRIDPDGWLYGAADPRREGLALGY